LHAAKQIYHEKTIQSLYPYGFARFTTVKLGLYHVSPFFALILLAFSGFQWALSTSLCRKFPHARRGSLTFAAPSHSRSNIFLRLPLHFTSSTKKVNAVALVGKGIALRRRG
jgi:hypothetical protein